MRHLIFYDDQCPFCQRSVKHVQKIDKKGIFTFESLSRAKELLKEREIPRNTLILVENFEEPHPRIWIRARGAFRILWLIGSWRKIIGVLCFLPGVLIDPFYRLVALLR
ncbi:MAG: hypothetical protein K1060chlam2_00674 [Chlamydiae bacterium]|nr:hypothetical protein [Chlamydiota bacterium]